MARKDNRARFLKALKEHDRAIYRAFMRATNDAANAASGFKVNEALRKALQNGFFTESDLDEVMRALGLGPEMFDGVQKAVEDAFRGGAAYHIASAPKALQGGLELAFQGYHPRIIEWLGENAARRVAEVSEPMREAVRTTITRGMEQQRGYAKIKLDLVGRMDGNRRVGGVIGLLDREAGYVADFRDALSGLHVGVTSKGVKKFWIKEDGTLGTVYSDTTRDRRFDRTIVKAIREGKPLPAETIENAASRYSAGLLRERGRRIARTEGNRAMAAGRAEHIAQMIDRGEAEAGDITKTWRHTARPGQRDNHAAMSGESRPWGERYSNGMMRPHEEGAPASEVVNCACVEITSTDWVAVAKRRGTF
ncbi:hypothetical protein [Sagittula sp. S175]|uniref:hypothetical protein n=1 Tax=Sagittula sp. S175 TaxID=3415129 RepID=UPI003C7D174F